MRKLVIRVTAVLTASLMILCAVPEKVYADTKDNTIKVPGKFKKATELELGELYEVESGKYFFDLEESGKCTFYFEGGYGKNNAILYDQDGVSMCDTSFQITSMNETVVAYLKAGRYYLTVSTPSSYTKPLIHEFCVDYESTNESFVENYEKSDDSAGEANKIELGKTYVGQLGLNDYEDGFKFTVPKDDEVTIYYKSTIANAKYTIIDASSLKKVKANLDEDVANAASAIADISGATGAWPSIIMELGRDPQYIADGEKSLTQKQKLKKGDYYLVIAGSALGGTAPEYHMGSYEFKITGTNSKNKTNSKNTTKKK